MQHPRRNAGWRHAWTIRVRLFYTKRPDEAMPINTTAAVFSFHFDAICDGNMRNDLFGYPK